MLAIETTWRDGCLVTLHNLSGEPAVIRLPADVSGSGQVRDVRQVLGDGGTVSSVGQEIPVDGYGFRWLRLCGETALM